jgi:phosphomannomutase
MTSLKHIFFDLDGTLTPSRSRMLPEHQALFEQLCKVRDVIVVSGSQETQMRKQLPDTDFRGKYYMLTQSGNHAIDIDGTILWSEKFSPNQVEAIFTFIKVVHEEVNLPVRDENNLIENRGSQISYSLMGHDEELSIKQAFDPVGSRRKALLEKHHTEVQKLSDAGVEITVGGTTCLDIFLKGKNKGYHVPRLIDNKGWSRAESIYVGDALEPGRNDASVVGVITTHAVKDPFDTFEFIRSIL